MQQSNSLDLSHLLHLSHEGRHVRDVAPDHPDHFILIVEDVNYALLYEVQLSSNLVCISENKSSNDLNSPHLSALSLRPACNTQDAVWS